MKVEVKPGKYVLAVSGGVDSMVLLDLLAKKPGIELVVAHFNHGIRPESVEDEELVRQKAKELGLAFEVGYGRLGGGASEEAARKARYKFLNDVQQKHQTQAIITAHHQDDLIETAIINMLRGTGRRGLVAILSNQKITRPLLGHSKKGIVNYAKQQGLEWHEDQTNRDDSYLRNYIRSHLMPDLTKRQRENILQNIDKVAKTDIEIDDQIAKLSQLIYTHNQIDRQSFSSLPVHLGEELVLYWLRQLKVFNFDKKTINRLSLAIKTSRPNTVCPVQSDIKLLISQKTAQFSHRV
ncbi:tRNA lysidine(34) synthetase TilS [Candidatus Saccharibacteria bacterium]|nr:tRNA lysidine(34) synthetase TilS [Candidatus Saccharibacteria bacterium]